MNRGYKTEGMCVNETGTRSRVKQSLEDESANVGMDGESIKCRK